ncbi:hypothetical protein MOQ_009263 [Trypanosoma cruzi marinkellei]|uniref:Uncharacterized protein n=1 Tax=Trypanosoma cruzi marinkellei TaxID=85056 RepID=K2MMX3_TRYCR|nr:hypothetical protein MOQ_009263 [Trypanosoma cruzi marinkellei]
MFASVCSCVFLVRIVLPLRLDFFLMPQARSHMYYYGGCGPLVPSQTKRRREEKDAKVRRSRVCPYATRLYRFFSEDIATQIKVCSEVLQVPSAKSFYLSSLTANVSFDVSCPSVVLTMWKDTTLAEIATLLLDSFRDGADQVFVESQVSAEGGAANVTCRLATRCASYVIRLYSGCVSAEGNATLCCLATIELRQVLSEERFVFPVRRFCNVDADTNVSLLPYKLGDPLFFTCVRVQ